MRTSLNVSALMDIAAQRGDRTQYAIAKRCGMRQCTLLRAVAGQSAPTLTTLNRIAAAYDVSVTDLLIDVEPQREAA